MTTPPKAPTKRINPIIIAIAILFGIALLIAQFQISVLLFRVDRLEKNQNTLIKQMGNMGTIIEKNAEITARLADKVSE